MEGRFHAREKDLAKSRSVGCSWEVTWTMSKGWHCWTGWHPCILEVTNLARGDKFVYEVEGIVRTITKVGTNSTMFQINKGVASLEEGLQGFLCHTCPKPFCPLYLTWTEGNILGFPPLTFLNLCSLNHQGRKGNRFSFLFIPP